MYHGERSLRFDRLLRVQTHYRPYLRLELLSRNQNGLRHDQGIGMGEEVRKIEYSIALKVTDIACLGLRSRPIRAR